MVRTECWSEYLDMREKVEWGQRNLHSNELHNSWFHQTLLGCSAVIRSGFIWLRVRTSSDGFACVVMELRDAKLNVWVVPQLQCSWAFDAEVIWYFVMRIMWVFSVFVKCFMVNYFAVFLSSWWSIINIFFCCLMVNYVILFLPSCHELSHYFFCHLIVNILEIVVVVLWWINLICYQMSHSELPCCLVVNL